MIMSKPNATVIAGVGMVAFAKPGASDNYDVMGEQAIRSALADAGVEFTDIEQAFAGYVYGDSTCGQKVIYRVGMTGIPVINVNNNCSTGSSALFLARQAVESGQVECALAVGFEQMQAGALGSAWDDRPSPFDKFDDECNDIFASTAPLALRYFGGAGKSHMDKYGTQISDFAKIRAKASRHAKNNPKALFRTELSEGDVLQSPEMIPGVMTRLMACPPTCGAAATILVSEAFAKKHGIRRDVKVVAQSMKTDFPSTFEAHDMMQLVGYDMTGAAARDVYESAGIGPDDLDVVE